LLAGLLPFALNRDAGILTVHAEAITAASVASWGPNDSAEAPRARTRASKFS
jgi:hypothetical protein